MKKFVLGVLLVTSLPTFAAGLKDCKALLGSYTCSLEGQSLELSIKKTTGDSANISMGNDKGETYIFDGVNRTSLAGDVQVQASCKNKGTQLEVITKTNGQSGSSVLTAINSQSATYVLGNDGEQPLSLNCSKK